MHSFTYFTTELLFSGRIEFMDRVLNSVRLPQCLVHQFLEVPELSVPIQSTVDELTLVNSRNVIKGSQMMEYFYKLGF